MKRGLWFALLVLLVTPLSSIAADKIVLDFPSFQVEEPATGTFYRAIVEEFENQHPEVDIDLYHVPYAGYVEMMLARFLAGNPPDIVHLPARDLFAFTQDDWFEPLEMIVGDALSEWTPLQEWCVVDGHTIMVLALAYGYVMGYNEVLLENAGAGIPTNWQDLLVTATRISDDFDGDGINDQWGFYTSSADEGTCSDVTINSFAITLNGDKIVSDDGTFNDDVFRTTVALFRALVETGAMPGGVGRTIGRELFAEGKVAMIIDGPWIGGYIDLADPSVRPHLKVTLIPSTLTNGTAGGVSNGLCVAKAIDEEKKQLAFEFIKLFVSPEWQRKYGTIGGQLPARIGVFSEQELATREELERLSVYAEAGKYAINIVPIALRENMGEYRRVMLDSILGYVLRDMPMEKALSAAKGGVSALLE